MKSSVHTHNFRKPSLSAAETRHTLLLAMAADAEKLRAQAERIKQLRAMKGRREGRFISQETAAHEVGVSARAYRTWEGSGATIKLPHLKALVRYYDTTEDWIEHGRDGQGETPNLFERNGEPSQLDRIELELAAITRATAELKEAQFEQAARDMEAQRQLEEVAQAIRRLQPPRRR
jgi:transcriptional regulator with XRE-family HTH domain